MPSIDTQMDKKTRLTTVKTLKYCVFERCGEQVLAAYPVANSNAVTSNSDPNIDEHRIVTSAFNHSISQGGEGAPRFQPTERIYMMDTYQMTGGEVIRALEVIS